MFIIEAELLWPGEGQEMLPTFMPHALPLRSLQLPPHQRLFASSVPLSLEAWPKIRRSSSRQPSPLSSLTDAVIPAARPVCEEMKRVLSHSLAGLPRSITVGMVSMVAAV